MRRILLASLALGAAFALGWFSPHFAEGAWWFLAGVVVGGGLGVVGGLALAVPRGIWG